MIYKRQKCSIVNAVTYGKFSHKMRFRVISGCLLILLLLFQNTVYAESGVNENHYGEKPQEFILYNLLGTSGNFERDIDNDGLADGWTSTFVTNTAVIDNTQVFTPTKSLGGIEITVPYDTEPGDIEYVCAYIKGVPDRTFLVLNHTSNSTVNSISKASDEFEFVSLYCIKPNINKTKVMVLSFSDFSQVEIKKVVFLNLTSIFGKGNEPSKAQMDLIMKNILSSGYFISHNYSVDNIDRKHPDRLLIWEDNFDGDSLNMENWSYFTRNDGGGNKQLEYNTDRVENVRVENGNLVITAIKENYKGRTWTSGHIITNNLREFQYGRIEAKMKLPVGKGFWPAFWTLGADIEMIPIEGDVIDIGAPYPDCGEIDIMEHVNSNDYTNAAIHWEGSSGLTSRIYYTDDFIDAFDVTEYHVYAIEWTEEQILFLVDNKVFGTFNLSEADTETGNAFRRPHYLILNLAVGGTFPGMPDNTTPDKGTMYVDWVRVYAPVGVTSYVDAESIDIDKEVAVISVKETIALNATIFPADVSEKIIRWSSSDESVAIVGGGYVTGLRPGSCIITATTKNGKTDTCRIIVTD